MKKWRAKKAQRGGIYWTVSFSSYHNDYYPYKCEERGSGHDKHNHTRGIYYKTEAEAKIECEKRNQGIKDKLTIEEEKRHRIENELDSLEGHTWITLADSGLDKIYLGHLYREHVYEGEKKEIMKQLKRVIKALEKK